MISTVAIDNHIIGWGIRETATPGQEDMIDDTKAFFAECRASGIRIMVPAVVLGEMLTAIDAKHMPMVLNLLKEGFFIGPYDALAAMHFAKLWQVRKTLIGELIDNGATRQELKADCMIVATAIAQKVPILYSHDCKLKAFAGTSLDVREIPREQRQTRLFMPMLPIGSDPTPPPP
jgi:hypothetical protein